MIRINDDDDDGGNDDVGKRILETSILNVRNQIHFGIMNSRFNLGRNFRQYTSVSFYIKAE